MRLALATIALALTFSSAAAAADRLTVSFNGSGTEHLVDVQNWILLDENECYLRKAVDQSAALSWSLGWTLRLGGKAGSPTGTSSMQGPLAGTEIADLCGEEETRPEDVPENWVHTSQCTDTLAAEPGGLTASVHGSTLTLTVRGPQYVLPENAVCSLRPRTEELQARVAIPMKTLPRGKTVVIPVGTAIARWGVYTPHLNCMHVAKPYDGYRSMDECGDDLTWSGTLSVSRPR